MAELIRTLVVDDDPLSRTRIRTLLEREGDIHVVGECADGAEAIPRILGERPELVFLDVQMPGVDGFGVVDAVGAERMPVTVFATAYVEFALRAFEACALDYLLKPFDEERFGRALARAREAARARRSAHDPRLEALMRILQAPARPEYPQLMAVKSGDQYRFVEVGEIDWIEADGNYIRLHTGKQRARWCTGRCRRWRRPSSTRRSSCASTAPRSSTLRASPAWSRSSTASCRWC